MGQRWPVEWRWRREMGGVGRSRDAGSVDRRGLEHGGVVDGELA